MEAGPALATVGARVVAREIADGRLAALRIRNPAGALRFVVVHHPDRAHAAVLRAARRLARATGGGGRRPP